MKLKNNPKSKKQKQIGIQNLNLTLANWRCFEAQKFVIPIKSLTITDQNGTGKTSLLAAIYSLLTARPWPGTKFTQSLRAGSEYYAILADKEWNLTGKISPSGRLSSKYNAEIDVVKKIFPPFPLPKILTYQPIDNYWLTQSRISKLSTLDQTLIEIWDKEYSKPLEDLKKAIKSKQQIIKKFLEEGVCDEILLKQINQKIIEESQKIWQKRNEFLNYLEENLEEFSSWINSPLKNWKVTYEVTNEFGNREKTHSGVPWSPQKKSCSGDAHIAMKNNKIQTIQKQIPNQAHDDNDKIVEEPLRFHKNKTPKIKDSGPLEGVISNSNPNLQLLWKRESLSGKILYGAQRDDFYISSNHLKAEEVLSRGEMRTLVLFIKYQATKMIKEKFRESKVWWFLDDIFNELDEKREQKIFHEILEKIDLFYATSTKNPFFEGEVRSIEGLEI